MDIVAFILSVIATLWVTIADKVDTGTLLVFLVIMDILLFFELLFRGDR